MKKTINKILSVLLIVCFLSLSMITVASADESFDDIKNYFSLHSAEQFDQTKLPSSGLMTPYNYFSACTPDGFEIGNTTLFYVNNSSNTSTNNAWYKLNFKNNSDQAVNLKMAILGLRVPTSTGAVYQETISVPADSTVSWGYGNMSISGGTLNCATHLMGYQQDYAMDGNAAFFYALMPETSASVEVSLSVAPFTGDVNSYPADGWETVGSPLALTGPAPAATSTFTLYKNFTIADGYGTIGTSIPDIADKVAVTVQFNIAPYKAFNRLTGKSDVPPAFEASTVYIPVGAGQDSVLINLPNYADEGVGDYWYTITEQAIDNVAGVAVDSTAIKYLHVQVVYDSNGNLTVGSINLHNAAPNADTGAYNNIEFNATGSDKTTGFTNSYGAGSLVVTKSVTGNMADTGKYFAVKVKLTAPTGKTVTGHIHYTGGFADVNGNTAYTDSNPGEITAGWSDYREITVYLKDGATVTFSNIPADVTYEITEENQDYEVTYAVDSVDPETGDTATTSGVTGSISDSLDTVTITNTKNAAVDVGVTLDNAPFVLLLIGSMAFFAIYFAAKRRKEEA